MYNINLYTVSAFDGPLRIALYELYRRLFGYKQPYVWPSKEAHVQINQSSKVNKLSLIKYNWKKIPLTWGTVPGQMVVRVQKVKSTGHIPGRSLGNDDSSPPAYTTVGVTRRRTSNFHHNNESKC
jgi:hypothetical protein